MSSSGEGVHSPLARRSHRVSVAEQPAPPPSCHTVIFLLVTVFSINESLASNALWVQLPTLVPSIREGTALTKYFVLLLEAANLSTVLYLLLQRFTSHWERPWGEVAFIYLTFILSVVALIPAAVLQWDEFMLPKNTASVILFTCVSLAALVQCLTPITYIPFVGRIRPAYVAAVLLGSSLSDLIPHVLAYSQGIGKHPSCQLIAIQSANRSRQPSHSYYGRISTTPLPPLPPETRFDSFFYFLSLAAVSVLNALAFVLLYNACARIHNSDANDEEEEEVAALAGGLEDPFHNYEYDGVLDDGTLRRGSDLRGNSTGHYSTANRDSLRRHEFQGKHEHLRVHRISSGGSAESRSSSQRLSGFQRPRTSSGSSRLSQSLHSKHTSLFPILMLLTVWLVAVLEGPLSSVKAHACYPTGNSYFMFGSLAACIARAIACLFAMRLNPRTRVTIVIAMTSLGTITLAYFTALIGFSYGTESSLFNSTGVFLGTTAWVTVELLFQLSLTAIGLLSAEAGPGYLLCFSALYTFGQAAGSLCLLGHFGVCRIYPPALHEC